MQQKQKTGDFILLKAPPPCSPGQMKVEASLSIDCEVPGY